MFTVVVRTAFLGGGACNTGGDRSGERSYEEEVEAAGSRKKLEEGESARGAGAPIGSNDAM